MSNRINRIMQAMCSRWWCAYESAIDVLSYATLHSPQQKTLYLSIDSAGSLRLGRLQQLPRVILALARDLVGASMKKCLGQKLTLSAQTVIRCQKLERRFAASPHSVTAVV